MQKELYGLDYTNKLLNLINSNDGIVTTKDVESNGIPRQYLSMLVNKGELLREANGIYLTHDTFEDAMYFIQLRSEKIIFSNETALYIHELTDRDPLQYSVCVPRGYSVTRLKSSGLIVYTVKESLHELGRETSQTVYGRDVSVYNLERTICDIIRYRNQMDGDMFATALKRYVLQKKKNLPLLFDYAQQFRIEKSVRQYLEVLL